MIIGVPREIKDKEFRVGIVPAGVRKLTAAKHTVLIESGAGLGSGISDGEFQAAGAEMVREAAAVYGKADLVMKVKEPQEQEYADLRCGLILFTYLHLAPLPELTRILLDKKVTAIAYETVSRDNEFLPLLAPMSEVAGRMSIQVGAHHLEKRLAAGVSCSAVSPGWTPVMWSSWAVAPWAPTQPRWRLGLALR